MSVKCGDIANFIEGIAPLELAEDWDNVGLLIGSAKKDIRKIILCLDVTSEVVDESIRCNADMILSHHPLIFEALKKLNEDDPKGQVISKLIRHDICVYSAHTNLDAAYGGVNDRLAQVLGLEKVRNLKNTRYEKLFEIKGREFSYGKWGFLKEPMELDGFVTLVKDRLGASSVRVIGGTARKVSKIAVFSGSFDGDFSTILKEKIDVLVTGDIKHHTALDLIEAGLCVIDAGHFNTERVVLPFLANTIMDRFKDIEVIVNSVEKDPFKYS
jgi:dinuclear metal center YbgI/SA1388 family protein